MKSDAKYLKAKLWLFIICAVLLSGFIGESFAVEIVKDGSNNIIAVNGLAIPGIGEVDVDLSDEPREFNDIWPNYPNPQSAPMFWGDLQGAYAARDALVDALQAAHVEVGGVPIALIGSGRYAFYIPIGEAPSNNVEIVWGYYRHFNNWLWQKGILTTQLKPTTAFYKGVWVRFSGDNTAPTADAGEDQLLFCVPSTAAPVDLDGSGSSDPDDDPLTFIWTLGGTVIATGVQPTVDLGPGIHTIALKVDDGKGGTATDEVVIRVNKALQAIAWADDNGNGLIDENEKGLRDILVRFPMAQKTAKHLTNSRGRCTEFVAEHGNYKVIVDESSLPAGTVCTTGGTSFVASVTEAESIVYVYFGFQGDALEELKGDGPFSTPDVPDDDCNPLVFVNGSPTFDNGKQQLGWDKAVDCEVCSEEGATWAQADTSTGDNVPWAIFEFEDQGTYKFDYVRFQTGFCDDAKNDAFRAAGLAYMATQLEVLVSTTTMNAEDFGSIGTFRNKYSEKELQWNRLAEEIPAKYIKVRLLNPVVTGKWTQLVEFVLANGDKGDLQPASSSMDIALVETMELLSNYPNPFNPTTTISFGLEDAEDITLNIFNSKGQLVRTLASGHFSEGNHSMTWNATNDSGLRVTSGLYFAILHAGDKKETHKMVLMK